MRSNTRVLIGILAALVMAIMLPFVVYAAGTAVAPTKIERPAAGQKAVLGRPLTIDWSADVSCTGFRLLVIGRSRNEVVADVQLPGDARDYRLPNVTDPRGLTITLEWLNAAGTGRTRVNVDAEGHTGVPVLTSPVNGSSIPAGILDIKWNKVPGARYYVASVRDAANNLVILGPTRVDGTTTRVLGLVGGKRIAVSVTAVSASPETKTEAVVTVMQPPPLVTVITTPRQGDKVPPGVLSVGWTKAKDAEWYRVQAVDATAGGAVLLDTQTAGTVNYAKVPGLVSGHAVSITVTAGNQLGTSSDSVWIEVKYVKPAPPVVLVPRPNARLAPGTLVVEWSPVDGALDYRITVTDTAANRLLAGTNQKGTVFTLDGLVGGQKLRITVLSMNPAGIGTTTVYAVVV